MKQFIRTNAAGTVKILVESNDQSLSFADSLQTIDITDNSQKAQIIADPHAFNISRGGVFVKKTQKERDDFEKAALPPAAPDLIGNLQKQIDALATEVKALKSKAK